MIDSSSERVLSFIVMASSNEYSRKILNSPTHAEPCLVHSAKQILMPDNWVFLTGKSHVEYRKVLNTLFTRKALRSVLLIIPIIFFLNFVLQYLHWYPGCDCS
jgi:cytochrome P450